MTYESEQNELLSMEDVKRAIKEAMAPEEEVEEVSYDDCPEFMYIRTPMVRFSEGWKRFEEARDYCRYLMGKLAMSSGSYYLNDARDNQREYYKLFRENGRLTGKAEYLEEMIGKKDEVIAYKDREINDLKHQLEHNLRRDEGATSTGNILASPIDKDRKVRIAYYLLNPESIGAVALSPRDVAELLNVGEKSVSNYLKEAEKQISKSRINGEEHFSWSKELTKIK